MRSNLNPPICSLADRIAAIELAREVGYAEASRRTGFKAATLRQWVARAKTTTTLAEAASKVGATLPQVVVDGALAEVAATPPMAVEPVGPVDTTTPWADRTNRVAGNLGALVEVAMTATMEAVAAGNSRKARELATVVGIALDKAQLLAGHATSRTQTESRHLEVHVTTAPTDVAAELAALRSELGLTSGPIDTTATEGGATDGRS